MSEGLERVSTLQSLKKSASRHFTPKNFNQRRKNVNSREHVGRKLEELFERLEKRSGPNISEDGLNDLSVELHDLTIEDENNPGPPSGSGRFFRPWMPSMLETYEKNMDSEKVKKDVQYMEDDLVEGDPIMRENDGWKTWMWASSMCYRLLWEVNIAPRIGTDGDSQTLKSLTEWRCTSCLPDDWRFQPDFSLNRDSWYPKYYWFLPDKFNKPHMKICMYHNAKGLPELVLREELLAIVAAMITRLGKKEFEKHVIFPVMLFSFMGERHGRILTAHFDGKSLVVHKSELYRFISQADDLPVHEPEPTYQNLPFRPLASDARFPQRHSFQSASSLSSDFRAPVPQLQGPSTFAPGNVAPRIPAPEAMAHQKHESQTRDFLNNDCLNMFTRYLVGGIDHGDSTMSLPLGPVG